MRSAGALQRPDAPQDGAAKAGALRSAAPQPAPERAGSSRSEPAAGDGGPPKRYEDPLAEVPGPATADRSAKRRGRNGVTWPELPVPDSEQHTVRGLVCGAAAFVLVLVARLAGFADGAVGLVLAGLLFLLVPTSRELSRRVLFTGAIALGWLPVLWWVEVPLGAVGRATLVLAAVAGGIATWVGIGRRPLERARALLPRVRLADAALPAVVALGVVLFQPLLVAKTAVQSLGVLMTGWDNSAHFSMVSMLRTYGVTVDALSVPPPSGGQWQFATYPEGFHALVATVEELMVGPARLDVGSELLLYGRGMAVVVLLAVVVMVAGICALPAARRRPAVALPAAVLLATAFLLGPGANAVNGGFANFLLACALTVVVVLVVLPMPRVFAPVPLAAAAGALVGVAAGWVLMLAVAVPAALALFVPVRRSRWRADRVRLIASVTVLVVMAECVARTAAVLLRVTATDPLLIVGGIVAPNLGLVAAATISALGACLWAGRRRARPVAMALAPVVGGAVAVALAVAQLQASGAVTYYGYKFMTGLLLAALGIALAAALHALPPPEEDGLLARVRYGVGGVALAAAATQVFGFTWVLPTMPFEDPIGAPGVLNQRHQQAMIDYPPQMTELARAAADVQAQAGNRLVFYLDAPPDGGIDPLLATQWYFALTDTWTVQGNTLATRYRIGNGSPDDVTSAARSLLLARPDALVVAPAVTAAQVRFLIEPDLANRVLDLP